MKKRLLALNLVLVLLLSLMPFAAFAEDAEPGTTMHYDSYGPWDHESMMFTPEESGVYAVSFSKPDGNPVYFSNSSGYVSGGSMASGGSMYYTPYYCYARDWDGNDLEYAVNYDRLFVFLSAGETYEFYLDPNGYYSPIGEWTFRAERAELPQLVLNETRSISRSESGSWAVFTPNDDGGYRFDTTGRLSLRSMDGQILYTGDSFLAALHGGESYYLKAEWDYSDVTIREAPRSGMLNDDVRWFLSDDGVLSVLGRYEPDEEPLPAEPTPEPSEEPTPEPTDDPAEPTQPEDPVEPTALPEETPSPYEPTEPTAPTEPTEPPPPDEPDVPDEPTEPEEYYTVYTPSQWPWEAFRSEIRQVVIGKQVHFNDINSALQCENLHGVHVRSGNPYFHTEDGVLFSGSTLIRYPVDKAGEYVIPEGVTDVTGFAFTNLTELTALEIPAETYVQPGAFAGTRGLQEIRYLGSEAAWNRMHVVFDEGAAPTVTFGSDDPAPIDPNEVVSVAYDSTRAGAMQLLWDMCGCPEPQMSTNPFYDLSPDAPYYKAVLWAVECGITKGVSYDRFAPDDRLTRAQFATYLWRACGEPYVDGACSYRDVQSGTWYYTPVLWSQRCTDTVVFAGTENGYFYPDQIADPLSMEYSAADGSFLRIVVGTEVCTEHHWAETGAQDATCTRWGYTFFTCSECGASKRERGDAPHGHEFQPWETELDPGCETWGSEVSVCVYDHDHVLYHETQPTGHDWSDWFVVQQPTEEKEGLRMRVCRNSFQHVEVELIPALSVKIVSQPADYNSCAGDVAIYHVEATGEGLTYQWYYRQPGKAFWYPSSFEGAQTDTLRVPVRANRDGQSYRCEVTDAFGNVAVSEIAGLFLIADEPPVIVSQPEDQLVVRDAMATFAVEAEGPGLTYQWYYRQPGKNSWFASTAEGAKSPVLTIQATERRDGQSYRCKVTTAAGLTVTSESAVLRLDQSQTPLRLLSNPTDQYAPANASVTFAVEAEGVGLTYQWYYRQAGKTVWYASGSAGANTSELTIVATAKRNGQSYRCVVTDAMGNQITSEAATIFVT